MSTFEPFSNELECPFCGTVNGGTDSHAYDEGTVYWAFCHECEARGPIALSQAEALQEWLSPRNFSRVVKLQEQLIESQKARIKSTDELIELYRATLKKVSNILGGLSDGR